MSVFFDEAGTYLDPTMAAMWALVGHQPQIPTTSRRRRLNLAGWVAPLEDVWGIQCIERGNTENFLRVLPNILDAFADCSTINVYLDNASWHKSGLVREFLQQNPKMIFHYLPKYSPELNVQERMWRYMRAKKTHCRRFETYEECWDATKEHFMELTAERVASLCSIN